jgi:PAS domain S-box-containing protein
MAAMGVERKAEIILEQGAVPQREAIAYCSYGNDREQTKFRSDRSGIGGVQGTFDFNEQASGRFERPAEAAVDRMASERYYKFFVEAMAEGALILSSDGVVLYCNEGFSRMMGLPAERLVGSPFSLLVHPGHRESFGSMLDRFREGEAHEEILLQPEDGRNLAVYLSGSARNMDDNEGICVVVADRTVTGGAADAAKSTKEGLDQAAETVVQLGPQLAQIQKMGATGTLVGGITHDFNNILSAIIGFSEMSLEDIDEGHPAKNYAAQILKAAIRGRDLVRQIVTLNHGDAATPDAHLLEMNTPDTREGKPKPSKLSIRGRERILLVDDEAAIIDMGQSMLRRLGYRVRGVNNGVQALDMFRGEPDAFDLVITDHFMPDMTGTELARELLGVRPDVPVILCTGYSEMVNRDVAKGLGIRELLMKPISRNELADTIRRVLDNKEG